MKGLINVEKIKINLTNGTSLEKPLITAFRGNNGIYAVLDNEINGTMGLPIILVSKLENNKLLKIEDQNEWNAVKENLRMIIAGNQVDYVKVEDALTGDEVFFTQLTLPVASFEALKNNYKPQEGSNMTGVPPVGETPNVDVAPTNPEVANPTPVVPNVDVTPTNPEVANPTPVTVTPEVSPVMPEAPQNSQVEAPVMDQPMVTPVAEQNTEEVPVDFTADKEAFLKACENMFDALVAKFNK